ncbi:hypothetical protein PIB30_024112 [Stylosanthes scabra]|uniref:Transposase n=1 Tax=Stylosanthes scabra TaxID=79078 RepID=A0ABU6V7U3_9FABA|nr:hypothetical protein [Stylosanthes scabra]
MKNHPKSFRDKHPSSQASSTSTTNYIVKHFNQNLHASRNRGLKQMLVADHLHLQ